MVTALPFSVTLAVAGGLAGGCWASVAVARRVQQAAVARERKNMSESHFLGGDRIAFELQKMATF